MSNNESRNVKDTRGRPRNETMSKWTEQIERAYMSNKLPLEIKMKDPKKQAKRLRLATQFKEVQEELGIQFRLLPNESGLIICLRKK